MLLIVYLEYHIIQHNSVLKINLECETCIHVRRAIILARDH